MLIFASVSLWLSWSFEPFVVAALMAMAFGYLYAAWPALSQRPDAPTISHAQLAYFAAGWVLLTLALVSPLNVLGMSYLLTAHMLQHLLLTVVAPPLLLLGIPEWMIAPLFRRRWAWRLARWLTYPAVAYGLYYATIWLWHLPALFDAEAPAMVGILSRIADSAIVLGGLALGALVLLPRLWRACPWRVCRGVPLWLVSAAGLCVIVLGVDLSPGIAAWGPAFQPHNPLHLLMTALFFGTAIVYWMPVLSPIAAPVRRLSFGASMLYLFVSTQPMMALGALLTFAPQPLYTTYAGAPLLFGFTRLGDQQLAGLIMWLLMDIPLLLGISILFFRWMNDQELTARAAAGEFDEIAEAAAGVHDGGYGQSGIEPRKGEIVVTGQPLP